MRFGLYFVALVQFIGAVMGFSLLEPILSTSGFPTDLNAVFFLLFIVTHLLGAIGAILIWAKRRLGFALSIAHQVLIIPVIHIVGVLFIITHDALGIFVLLTKSGPSVGIQFHITLLQTLSPGASDGVVPSFIGVNLFALFCTSFLLRERGKVLAQPRDLPETGSPPPIA
jgi:hypothetical protein